MTAVDPGEEPRGPQPSLLLDQTKAQRAEKNSGGRPGPPLSQGLDLPLCETTVTHSKTRMKKLIKIFYYC